MRDLYVYKHSLFLIPRTLSQFISQYTVFLACYFVIHFSTYFEFGLAAYTRTHTHAMQIVDSVELFAE